MAYSKNITVMWQRIQTLYLIIATGLSASLFFCNLAGIIGPDGEEITIRYYEKSSYMVLMIMILAAQICSIFSYRHWLLQARVCIIAALLLVGFQVWLGIDFIRMRNDMVFNISGVFPIACAILDGLAARASLIDEMTITAVRSARKIRRNRRK